MNTVTLNLKRYEDLLLCEKAIRERRTIVEFNTYSTNHRFIMDSVDDEINSINYHIVKEKEEYNKLNTKYWDCYNELNALKTKKWWQIWK